MLTGGHTRWSIHSAWRDDKLMLQQQRGEPVLFMSTTPMPDSRGHPRTAGRARVYNDLDSFEIMVEGLPRSSGQAS